MPFTALKLAIGHDGIALHALKGCAPPNAVYGFKKIILLYVKKYAIAVISIAYFFIATNPPPNAPAQPHMDFDPPINLFSVIVFTINKPIEIRDAQ